MYEARPVSLSREQVQDYMLQLSEVMGRGVIAPGLNGASGPELKEASTLSTRHRPYKNGSCMLFEQKMQHDGSTEGSPLHVHRPAY